MKVSATLKAVSLCLAGLVKAAPVDGSAELGIVMCGEKGDKYIDFKYALSKIQGIDESTETESDSSMTDKKQQVVDQLIKEIQEQDFLEKFLSELMSAFQLQDGFEESVDSNKRSEVSKALSPSEKKMFEGV